MIRQRPFFSRLRIVVDEGQVEGAEVSASRVRSVLGNKVVVSVRRGQDAHLSSEEPAAGTVVLDLRNEKPPARDGVETHLILNCPSLHHLMMQAVLKKRSHVRLLLLNAGGDTAIPVQQAICSVDVGNLPQTLRGLHATLGILLVKFLRGDTQTDLQKLDFEQSCSHEIRRLRLYERLVLGAHVRRLVVQERLRSRLWESSWNVGVVHRPLHTLLSTALRPEEVGWIKWPERNSYMADPFPDPRQAGRFWVERFDFLRQHGCLVSATFDGRSLANLKTALDEVHHVSYPQAFEYQGAIWVIPESAWGGEIALYRMSESGVLTRICVLVDNTTAADPTLLRRDGKWWLFATESVPVRDTELSVWYADELTGPWKPHRENPVKVDVTSARPAGAFFTHENELYRPAQVNDWRYGTATVICRVTELNTSRYSEVVVRQVGPLSNRPVPLGPHTVNSFGEMTLIDGKSKRFRPWLQIKRRYHRIRRRGQGRGCCKVSSN